MSSGIQLTDSGISELRSSGSSMGRNTIICLSSLFVISRIAIWLYLAGIGTDLGVHAHYARLMIAGGIPFRDFDPEYPPLAFAITAAPLLFDHSTKHYFIIFRTICCLIDCLTWLILLAIKPRNPFRALTFILASTCLGPVLYDRLDIVLGFVLLATMVALRKEWYGIAAFSTGLGIAFKLIPLVWLPALLCVIHLRRPGNLWKSALFVALPTVVSLGVIASLGGYQFSKLISYHGRRGIQLESVPATLEMLLMRTGVSGHVSFEYGSSNLHTPVEHSILMASAMGSSLIIVVVGPLLVYLRRKSPDGIEIILAWTLVCAMILSKVLSVQYFVFLLPILTLLPSWRTLLGELLADALVLAIFVITGAIFPWLYDKLNDLDGTTEDILLLRNELLIVLALVLLYRIKECGGKGQAIECSA